MFKKLKTCLFSAAILCGVTVQLQGAEDSSANSTLSLESIWVRPLQYPVHDVAESSDGVFTFYITKAESGNLLIYKLWAESGITVDSFEYNTGYKSFSVHSVVALKSRNELVCAGNGHVDEDLFARGCVFVVDYASMRVKDKFILDDMWAFQDEVDRISELSISHDERYVVLNERHIHGSAVVLDLLSLTVVWENPGEFGDSFYTCFLHDRNAILVSYYHYQNAVLLNTIPTLSVIEIPSGVESEKAEMTSRMYGSFFLTADGKHIVYNDSGGVQVYTYPDMIMIYETHEPDFVIDVWKHVPNRDASFIIMHNHVGTFLVDTKTSSRSLLEGPPARVSTNTDLTYLYMYDGFRLRKVVLDWTVSLNENVVNQHLLGIEPTISICGNPCVESSSMAFGLARPSRVKVSCIDVLGRKIDLLPEQYLDVGIHSIPIECGSMPAGLYQATVVADNLVSTCSFIVQ